MAIKDLQLLENTITTYQDNVKKNISIISKEALGQNYMVRIDPQPMNRKPFKPYIAYSQANMEDRTVPRVVACPHLLGCIHAIGSIINNVFWYDRQNEDHTLGFYIHDIPFNYALKPTNKLVYDASFTDEHWLVQYNENTKTYPAHIAGKLFINKISTTPYKNKNHIYEIEFYVEIVKADGLAFNEAIHLQKGYHSVSLPYEQVKNNKEKGIVVKPITEKEFMSSKKVKSTLESFNPKYKISKEDCSNEQLTIVNNKQRRTRIDVAAYHNNMILAAYQDETETYDFPGGGLDKGETYEAAGVREGMEEAGWIITQPQAIKLPGNWVFSGSDDRWFDAAGWDEELEVGVIATAISFNPDHRFSSEGDARIFSLIPIGQVKASLLQALMSEIARPRQKLIYQLRLEMIKLIEQKIAARPKFLDW